jgi:hypothetical protein
VRVSRDILPQPTSSPGSFAWHGLSVLGTLRAPPGMVNYGLLDISLDGGFTIMMMPL